MPAAPARGVAGGDDDTIVRKSRARATEYWPRAK